MLFFPAVPAILLLFCQKRSSTFHAMIISYILESAPAQSTDQILFLMLRKDFLTKRTLGWIEQIYSPFCNLPGIFPDSLQQLPWLPVHVVLFSLTQLLFSGLCVVMIVSFILSFYLNSCCFISKRICLLSYVCAILLLEYVGTL